MSLRDKKKVILINGPTASGKSSLSIKLAQKINGKIISVDSRQIFKEIPVFSGAVSKKEKKGVRHYFVGELSLIKGEEFNISNFREKFFQKIEEILEKGKTPILVGGSSFFFESIVYDNFFPEIEPDLDLRKELKNKTKEELFQEILEKDEKTAERIDKNNPARLIRAVEIIRKNGFVPEIKKEINQKYDFREIFLWDEREKINQKIRDNVIKRAEGMIREAEILRSKISAEKFIQLGLAYKNIFDFWNDKISKEEFIYFGIKEEQKYAKRQMTYLNKFFKNLPEKKWFNFTGIKKKKFISSNKNLLEKVLKFIQ